MEDSILCSITGQQDVQADRAVGEKRKTVRIPLSARVKLTVIRPKPREAMAIVREISGHGVGVLAEMAMESGSEFVLEFPHEGFAPWWVLYRAVRCTAVSSQKRLHLIGALFAGMQAVAPQVVSATPFDSLASADQASELDRIRQAVLGM